MVEPYADLTSDIQRHLTELREQLAQLQSGGLTTREAAGGIMVDTTKQTISRIEGYIATFEALLREQRSRQ